MPSPQTRPLSEHFFHILGAFQWLVALPFMFRFGTGAWSDLFGAWRGFYYFIVDFMTTLMASGIFFTALLQRGAVDTKLRTLVFEAIKTTLATGMWIWLIADSASSPSTAERISRAAAATVLLV
ncbi:hypothetical protein K504DRAFT_502140 [Pleomassaria siparia CBS 279.74]|uniref:MARVEL domain-containing protein n=1 Tax=Pleomassaria siparia CBS 279.74 TaxID=1314801 RepID=A0A6G1KAB8_9PLEO|nr:hypothetical protein K504DRAFT_502140 [Pleomassaria siparia CBS 279.74]